ncbi:hypothetical protein Trydic_g21537 [Trypoxylus dichotomus]
MMKENLNISIEKIWIIPHEDLGKGVCRKRVGINYSAEVVAAARSDTNFLKSTLRMTKHGTFSTTQKAKHQCVKWKSKIP